MFNVEESGDFGDLLEKLDNFPEKVTRDEIFTESFLRENTSFSGRDEFEEFLDKFTEKELENGSENLDSEINENTQFSEWGEFWKEASNNFIKNYLNFE